jgi:hypothetical protein
MAFIKIDREILSSYCFANPNHLKVWIWLLVKANFKKTFASLKIGKGYITVKVERGQLIFGRFKAEQELGLDGSMIYRILQKFEEQEQIKIEANNQYSIITICKYDVYQNNIVDIEQPTSSQRTTIEQPTQSQRTADELDMNTSKEGLEGKEEKEDILVDVPSTTPLKKTVSIEERAIEFKREFKAFVNDYPRETLEAFYEYWIEPNKSKTKMKFEMEKTWDLNLRLKKWARNSFGKKKEVAKPNQPFF